MRIVVSGGGTAGHISPALATCDALKSLDSGVELLYIGQANSMEARIVAGSGIRFAAIKAGKFRRMHAAGALAKVLNVRTLGPNARDALRTVAGLGDSLRVLRQFKPDVVFLKGGFVCVPVGLAARLLRIPYVIHESDVSPGLANRILSRWARRIAVGFPVKSYHDFDPARLVYVGNPVRRDILLGQRAAGLVRFGLEDGLPVVLVTGGSQGARQINDVVLGALPQLLEFCQVLHQTGEGEIERVKFELRRRDEVARLEHYHPYAFILKEMGEALATADVVVGRAGVGTITDSAVLGKPTILIPNYEMAGHQMENARVLSRAGAARVLDGAKLTPAQLTGEVKRILDDPEERARLANGIARFGKMDAAVELARLILEAGRAGKVEHNPNLSSKSDKVEYGAESAEMMDEVESTEGSHE